MFAGIVFCSRVQLVAGVRVVTLGHHSRLRIEGGCQLSRDVWDQMRAEETSTEMCMGQKCASMTHIHWEIAAIRLVLIVQVVLACSREEYSDGQSLQSTAVSAM
jgi:hypothetical protein